MKTLFTLLLVLGITASLQAKTFTVTATDFSFSPATQTVQVGDVVHWAFEGTHTVTSGTTCTSDGKFNSGTKNTGDTYDFTFTSIGSFPYFCTFHCSMGMTGTITVTAASGVDVENTAFAQLKSFPNPFSKSATLGYELTRTCNVNIKVTDISGKEILVIKQTQGPGLHNTTLNLDAQPTGIYFLNFSADGIATKSLMLVKE